jgi:hypothetical protein
MAIVIDTCSLVAMARYYLPLDINGILTNFIKKGLETGEIILLDAIQQEAIYTSQGIAIKAMPYLKEVKYAVNTTEIFLPSPKKFHNLVDNNFCVRLLKNELTEEEYVLQKEEFLKSGDGRIIIYCMYHKEQYKIMPAGISVLTEETKSQNDGKLFQKLPSICDFLKINTITLTEYLKAHGIKIERIHAE